MSGPGLGRVSKKPAEHGMCGKHVLLCIYVRIIVFVNPDPVERARKSPQVNCELTQCTVTQTKYVAAMRTHSHQPSARRSRRLR